jgi:hypothetical protein
MSEQGNTKSPAELRASRNVGIGLTTLLLGTAATLAIAFNATSVGKPDFSEANIARHTERELRSQVHKQFDATANKVADLAVKDAPQIEPGNVMLIGLQGGVAIDPAKAHNDAVADIRNEAAEQKTQGNTLAVVCGLVGLLAAGKTMSENRKLRNFDPQPPQI